MPETAELAAKLKFGGEKLSSFFDGLTDSQWNAEVYTEGAVWNARNILAHLMTAERAFVKLFENIRQGGTGVSEDFVIDRYNASQQRKTSEWDTRQLLQEYRAARTAMVQWVSGIGDSDLEKSGRHPFLGVTTLREMVKMIYIHNQMHYRDLRRALRD
jgi:hypothetical protein